MDREEMNRLLRQEPFKPFRVVLRDGRHYDVRYPRMNQLAYTYVKIGIPRSDTPEPLCHHLEFVPLAEIERVEELPVSAPANSS